MKTRLLVAALLLGFAVPSFAQDSNELVIPREDKVEYSKDKYRVVTNRFGDNWFISIGAGAQVYIGDHERQMLVKDRLTPAFDFGFGKWFTPGIGTRLMITGLSVNGATQDGTHGNGEPIDGKPQTGYWLQYQDFNYFNLRADVLFNLNGLIGGYKEKRVYSISPYLGLGWAHSWGNPTDNALSGTIGLLNSFRLCKQLNLDVDLRGTLYTDTFDGERGGRCEEGIASATIGLTYKFKKRGWDKEKIITKYNNEAVDALLKDLDALRAENDALKNKAGEVKEVEKLVYRSLASNLILIFKFDKADLSRHSRAQLGMFADAVKAADSNSVYVITGYADEDTGTPAYNEPLSKRRAEAVKKCLVEEFGVSADQLEVDYKGGVKRMFYDDPRLSRSVIIRMK